MRMYNLHMNIIDKKNDYYVLLVSLDKESTRIMFSPNQKDLIFTQNNYISKLLKKNEYQLRKMLHNKRKDTYYIGFNLNFCLRDKKDVAAFNDRNRIVVLDRRNNDYRSYTIKDGIEPIDKLYIDASLSKDKIGGIVVIHKDINNNYKLYTEKFIKKTSNLLELMAAIKGMKILKSKDKLRIISDSLYVRKGLTEWIINWRLNNWYTANGERVKNIFWWKEFEKLTDGKYVEFKWVKAHSNHFENTLCDLYAKEITRQER